jgi:predicted GH43/DUF377 family glycosyl hydrolase
MRGRYALVLMVIMAIAGYSAAQTEWIVYDGNPVIEPVESGSWCANGRWVDSVVRVDGRYHMFFLGTAGQVFSAPMAIGHATSVDGITWRMDPNNPVLTPAAEGNWGVTLFISSAVIHDGTEFRMWYAGSDGRGSQVGYATSPDGTNWTRHRDNPVFGVGPEGSFDDTWVNPHAVIIERGKYHMWYGACGDPSLVYSGSVGYATSTDGLSWTRRATPVLEAGSGWESLLIYAPKVFFDGTWFHLWYTGLDGIPGWPNSSSIGYATSPDGIVWTKDPENPIEELGDWVAHGVVLCDRLCRTLEMFFVQEVPDFSVLLATSAPSRGKVPRNVASRVSVSRASHPPRDRR